MSLNSKIFLFVFLGSIHAICMNCDLARAIKHPLLSERAEFWSRLAFIDSKNDFAIAKLISEYAPEALTAGQNVIAQSLVASRVTIEISKKAEKQIDKLSKKNSDHYDQFLKTVNEQGIQGLYNNPGKWHHEKLPQYGPSAHSVRLDSGMRVLFHVEKDSVIVKAVDNTIGH